MHSRSQVNTFLEKPELYLHWKLRLSDRSYFSLQQKAVKVESCFDVQRFLTHCSKMYHPLTTMPFCNRHDFIRRNILLPSDDQNTCRKRFSPSAATRQKKTPNKQKNNQPKKPKPPHTQNSKTHSLHFTSVAGRERRLHTPPPLTCLGYVEQFGMFYLLPAEKAWFHFLQAMLTQQQA